MNLSLVTIRLIQLKRSFTRPILEIPIFGILAVALVYSASQKMALSPEYYYLLALLAGLCLWLQINRKDRQFVNNQVEGPYMQIFWEYFFLTLPISFTCLLTKNWIGFPVLISMLALLPFLNLSVKKGTSFRNISKIIPKDNFEWISSMRKSMPYLIPIYLIALVFSWFRVVPLIALWIISISVASFYLECESLQILREKNLSSENFILNKLMRHSKILLVLSAPVILVNTIFNTEYLVINILFLLIQISLLCFSICFKYSGYKPNENPIANNIILSMVSLFTIVPYLLPIPMVMAFIYYKRAKSNLKNYLDDRN